MRMLVVHDRAGNISALATAPADAPMLALANTPPGQMTSEVEAPDVPVDAAEERAQEPLLRLQRDYRLVTAEATLVPKTDKVG